MSKLTKNQRIDKLVACLRTQGIKMRELETRLSTQEKWSDYADNMLTELNHALPDPEYDAKCEAAVAGVEASIDRHRERLGLNKPQLKQLGQSVFDGLDEKWRFATVSSVGIPFVYDYKPTGQRHFLSNIATQQRIKAGKVMRIDEYDYDTSNWQNSLIERDDIAKELLEVDLSSELTGSDLAKEMLARGDKYVMCRCWNSSYADIEQVADIVSGFAFEEDKKAFAGVSHNWDYAIPINNQGEPLTASEVGL